MGYQLTRKDFGNDPLLDTLVALKKTLAELGLELYIVGAGARDICMKVLKSPPPMRGTTDIDIAIALDNWDMFDLVSQRLQSNYFKKDLWAKQKFFYKGPNGENDYEVDVVPFGKLANNEVIGWPPEGNPEMSVRCFTDVMSAAEKVRIDDIVEFLIAPLSGQFLIKLDTWIDRHAKTNKDAYDMFYLANNFYWTNIIDKFPPPEEVVDADASNFDLFLAGIQWMAAELKLILTDAHRRYYAEYLDEEITLGEKSPLFRDLAEAANGNIGDTSIIMTAMKQFAKIIEP